ncbi:phage tail protein [Pseudomonas asiatica]|uniref:Phage tail protein n=2 Tax=Pseudomonas TaxID=286 RepID=A0A7X3F1C0_9PSED|nr:MULTISPECIES: phage tail protein [Pseudomonas]MBA6129368.1 phage tail protein [Pseudomonas juntendi]MBF8801893.1 phage tail protein [Pseudomonas asiatica]MBO2889576.1 phage tail protein [Pseudomonas asiatica]MBV4514943.1 phage tail protein [Pseudomonas kurunegalensis]MCA4078782.1 phage tail protein [Pseudomonas kurunegalensis]
MAARFPLPNGSVLEIASVLAAAVAFTALTNAAPPVASAAGHTIKNGDVLVVSSGWSLINDRAVRAASVAADKFSLAGLNTTNTDKYTAGAGLGSVIPVTNWAQISKVTAFTSSGGEQQYLTVGYLEDDDDRQFPTNRNPITLSITVEDQPAAAYVGLVEAYGDSKELTVVRLKLPNGDQILYPGYVSITTTPTMERNNLMTRTISIALSGRPVRYLAGA